MFWGRKISKSEKFTYLYGIKIEKKDKFGRKSDIFAHISFNCIKNIYINMEK
jgi:hypothetical protein